MTHSWAKRNLIFDQFQSQLNFATLKFVKSLRYKREQGKYVENAVTSSSRYLVVSIASPSR